MLATQDRLESLLEGVRVLVVEDDEMFRATLVELLRLKGFTVETAGNGAEALAAICHSPPAVVLLDVSMPVMDGFGLAAEVEARGIEVPIVLMTGGLNPREAAAKVGATAWLAKPFRLPDLLPAVVRAAFSHA